MSSSDPPALPCPFCGYNVFVQVLGKADRCPECGGVLPKIELESHTSLAAQWGVVEWEAELARFRRWFIGVAVANLAVFGACVLWVVSNSRFPSAMRAFSNTQTGGTLVQILFWAWVLALPLGGLLLIMGLAHRERRCRLLGIANGICAMVMFCWVFCALGSL